MARHFFYIDNIHCTSCEDDIQSVLQEQDASASVHFLPDRGTVQLDTNAATYDLDAAMQELHAHGFNVRDANRVPVSTPHNTSGVLQNIVDSVFKRRDPQKRARNHAQICLECSSPDRYTDEAAHTPPPNDETLSESSGEAFRAVFAVQGMTCASCASSISAAVKQAVPNVLDVSANPLNGAAYVLLKNRGDASRAEEAIEDAGFAATLTEVLPLSATHVKEYSLTGAVRGMTCASCAGAVKRGLESLPYVSRASIEVLDGSANIITTTRAPLEEIRSAVQDAGYDIEFPGGTDTAYHEIHSAQARQQSRTVTLEVQNIFCERCPARIMDVLNSYGDAVDIVDAVSVSTPYVKFTYLPSPPSLTIRSILSKLAEANPDLGFEIVHPKLLEELAAENQQLEMTAFLRRLLLTSAVAVPTSLLMLISPHWAMNSAVMFALATPIYFFAADVFHRKALREVYVLFTSPRPWKRRLFHFGSMNLLMSLGTSISYWASILIVIINRYQHDMDGGGETYFDSVIFLTFFLLIGRFLDVYSKIKTTAAVSLISKTRPDTTELYDTTTKTTTHIPIELVEVGDVVAVFAGQRCAVDGIVMSGASDFDEAMLTGESLPVPKTVGDDVYAGTLNTGQQTVVLKVTAVGEGTLLDDIVDAVRKGNMQRAPIERYVEQFTGMFVPLVVYLALAVWFVWYLASGSVLWGMQFAIATFVVACPCGIGLAAPTALYIGSGLAAKYGILARGGGDAFQEAAGLNVMCFDKTGTITVGGDLRITDSWGAESDEAVQLAMRLEADSVHPLARAVTDYGKDRKVTAAACAEILHIDDRGRGMQAEVTGGEFAGQCAVLGNERVIREVANVEPTREQQTLLARWKSEGKSVVLLAIRERGVVLMLAAADQIRSESRQVIHRLHELGMQCWMISGDNEETAKAVARQVGIPSDRVIAGVLPRQKADRVRHLQMTAAASFDNAVGGRKAAAYGRAIVGMVGDGVNDAPALATSDVGIALGRGADIALSSSQFVLLREDLRALPLLVEISKAVMWKVKANFFWAGIYNFVAIPVAAGVFYPWTHKSLSPVWASLAMALSSVSVMVSSLMLRRYHPKD